MGRLYSVKTTVDDWILADTIASLLRSFHTASPVFVRELDEDNKRAYEIEAVAPVPEKVIGMLKEICPSPDPDIRISTVDASDGMYEKSTSWCVAGIPRGRSQWRLVASVEVKGAYGKK